MRGSERIYHSRRNTQVFPIVTAVLPGLKKKNLWKDGGYEPVSGNIIFFDWNGDGVSDHVGIVEYTMNGVVHTIEGNSGDACARMSYVVGSSVIMGYGTPFYEQATLQ